jgi:hypothetical protein
MAFEAPLRLEPKVLAHLAPAVERPGIHLGVWHENGELIVWGATRSLPDWSFVLEVVRPGLLVLKYRRPEPSSKFANVAVLEGADIKFLRQQDTIISDAPAALAPLLKFYSTAGRSASDDILVRIAISMRAHGRGGSLLVVPHGSDAWRGSIVRPIGYPVQPPQSEIEQLLECCSVGQIRSEEELEDAVHALAGLTAVDGATVVSDRFGLLAFGAKITPAGPEVIDSVLLTEPTEDSLGELIGISQLGGTRHLSAAQFVLDQKDCIAMVASQDARFTVFAWSSQPGLVHAHRLETLLL